MKGRARRKNAGRNMKALLARDMGDAGDDDFYKNIYGGFDEKSDDKEFQSAEESSTDYADSDIDASESDIDETKAEENIKHVRRRNKVSKKTMLSSTYGYPYVSSITKQKSDDKIKKDIDLDNFNSNLAQIKSDAKTAKKTYKPIRKTMTQEQLLREAKKTEQLNLESLKNTINIDLNNKANKPKRILRSRITPIKSPAVELCSKIVFDENGDDNLTKRGRTMNTLSFQHSISKKQCDPFFQQKLPTIRRPECEISAKKARYRDPISGSYFHDASCFRKLRSFKARTD